MKEIIGTPKTKESDKFFKSKHKEGTYGYIFENGNRHARRKARKELELRIRKDLISNKKKYGEKKVEPRPVDSVEQKSEKDNSGEIAGLKK